MMEVYAGALAHADHHDGPHRRCISRWVSSTIRLIILHPGRQRRPRRRKRQGLLNEMTFFNNLKEPFERCCAAWMSSRTDDLHTLSVGWAHAMDTPFPSGPSRSPRISAEPGMGSPFLPKRHQGARPRCVRSFRIVIDIHATVLRPWSSGTLLGLRIQQDPVEGRASVYAFDDS